MDIILIIARDALCIAVGVIISLKHSEWKIREEIRRKNGGVLPK